MRKHQAESTYDGGIYRSLTTPLMRRVAVSDGSTPLTKSLSLELARQSLSVWATTMLAREGDCDVKCGEFQSEKPTVHGDRTFVVAQTLTMYPKCHTEAYRRQDDPPEAAFHVLQVEIMLDSFLEKPNVLVLKGGEISLLDQIRKGNTILSIAQQKRKDYDIVRKQVAELALRIESHRLALGEYRVQEGDSEERKFLVHHFVLERAVKQFPDGLRILRQVEKRLSSQLTEYWGASIPKEAAQAIRQATLARRRELNKAKCQEDRRVIRESVQREEPRHEPREAIVTGERDLRFVGYETRGMRGRR